MLDYGSSTDGLFLPTIVGSSRRPLGRRKRRGRRSTGPAPGESRVLVVEDDVDAREALGELLEQEGIPTISVGNGREALDVLATGQPVSLILLDMTMPVMDGWEFCEELAKDDRLAKLPVAILTASASHHRLPARRHDAGLFVKPVDFDRLLQAVRRYTG